MKKRFYQFSFLSLVLISISGYLLYLLSFYHDQKLVWKPQQPLECVSYTAFQNEEAPWMLSSQAGMGSLKIPQSRVDTDLEIISKYSRCIRIYSITGVEYLPELARKHHLKILFGIWINNDSLATELEINRAIDLIKKNTDVVEAVVVGNETLLRKEITSKQLIEYITQVKKALPHLTITYADVWEFWLKYPEVAEAVDQITVHILPYWEDDPVSISGATAHVQEIYKKISQSFHKEVRIGETGWPSRGRMREGSKPSLNNQHLFLDQFLNWVKAEGIHYNIIEAFNQNWKRFNEGTVGGYWGIFNRPDQTFNHWNNFLEKIGFNARDSQESFIATLVVLFLLLTASAILASLLTSYKPLFYEKLISTFYGLILFYTLGLVFDPRYREFPNIAFLLPVILSSVALYFKKRNTNNLTSNIELNFAWLLFIFSFVLLIQEGLRNFEALIWVGMILALGFNLLSKPLKHPAYQVFLISLLTYFGATTLRMSLMESQNVAHFCSEQEALFAFPAICKARDFMGMLIYYKAFAYFAYLLLIAHYILRGTLLPVLAVISSMIGLVLYQCDASAIPFIISIAIAKPILFNRNLFNTTQ